MSRKTIRVDELIDRIALAAKAAPRSHYEAPRFFIASFCGTLEREYPELARAVAKAAGMPELYPAEVQS